VSRVVVAGCRILYLRSERRLVVVSIGYKASQRALERVFPVAGAPTE
jgi:hypothetical protein